MLWLINRALWEAVEKSAPQSTPSCSVCGQHHPSSTLEEVIDSFVSKVDDEIISLDSYQTVEEIARAAVSILADDFKSCDTCGSLYCDEHQHLLVDGNCPGCRRKSTRRKRHDRQQPESGRG
jgi:hypothetical protein